MKVSKLIATSNVAALANAARITSNGNDMVVEWTAGNKVKFRRSSLRNNSVELKSVVEDYMTSTVWLSSELSDLEQSKQDMVAAAAIVLGLTSFMISREIVSIINSSYIHVEPQVQRPATSWEGARGYTLSQHRKEPAQHRPTVTIDASPKPTVHVETKVSGKAGLVIAGATLLGLGLLAIAASRN
ncbi:hypothetical protein D3C76_37040 [compost metagenome]